MTTHTSTTITMTTHEHNHHHDYMSTTITLATHTSTTLRQAMPPIAKNKFGTTCNSRELPTAYVTTAYLFGMEVVVVVAIEVFVAYADSGPCLAVAHNANAVVPKTTTNLVVGKPPQN